jgi:hypothetical protein
MGLGPVVAAGPVMCTTTLEAPELSSAATEPVEVTTCAPVETTSELVERRLYRWTAPYERGVDLLHQITDLFGIAVAGEGGTQVMGLGFPDQTIIWDAAATSSTTRALLEEQGPALPLRTQDLTNGFDSSLALESLGSEQTLQSKPEFVEIDNAALQPLW